MVHLPFLLGLPPMSAQTLFVLPGLLLVEGLASMRVGGALFQAFETLGVRLLRPQVRQRGRHLLRRLGSFLGAQTAEPARLLEAKLQGLHHDRPFSRRQGQGQSGLCGGACRIGVSQTPQRQGIGRLGAGQEQLAQPLPLTGDVQKTSHRRTKTLHDSV
jgi:hypothetical protein